MKRKGFTLIELLAIIVLVALITVLVAPSVIESVDASKKVSYDALIKNIATASELYYQECEYGDLAEISNACIFNDGELALTLYALADNGFLNVADTDKNGNKIVLNPITNENISGCQIIIEKKISNELDENGVTSTKVMYTIYGTGDGCPTTDEYAGVE